MLLSRCLSSSGLDWLNSDLGVARSASPSRPIVNEELWPDNPARSFGLANAPMAPDLKNPRLFISRSSSTAIAAKTIEYEQSWMVGEKSG
jgi:hypothetical protein